jgi:hypothetical protein
LASYSTKGEPMKSTIGALILGFGLSCLLPDSTVHRGLRGFLAARAKAQQLGRACETWILTEDTTMPPYGTTHSR